jgi:transmembrane 9 superfamily protein 2/4
MSHYIFHLFIFIIITFSSIKSAYIFDYSHVEGSKINIEVGKLSSYNYIIPYSYNRLRICNLKRLQRAEDNLGEILTGEDLYISDYNANINENKYCETLCYNQFTRNTLRKLKRLIDRNYFTNWYVDKLPAGLIYYNYDTKTTDVNYFYGIPLGKKEKDKYIVYNHFYFKILINKISDKKYNIVGLSILPMSIKHNGTNAMCEKKYNKDFIFKNIVKEQQLLTEEENQTILYTYDIQFEYSNITLASRWDHYRSSDKKIHWTGIIISVSILAFLTIIIALILTRNIKRDIETYNYQVVQMEDIDNIKNLSENNWKQVSGDVFRPPRVNKMLLSSIIGTGFQLYAMLFVFLFLGAVGFLNPEKRSNILSLIILCYILMGILGGYVSAMIYKIMNGYNWLKMGLLTSFLFPGTLFFGYIIVNIILSIEKSTAAVNISDLASLFFLWIFCTLPLILIGTFLGMHSKKQKMPCKVNAVPSKIPEKPWYLHYRYLSSVTGLICFITILFELNYIMSALWKHELYFVVPFLWISYLLFVIVSGEVSVIVVFWNLCYGDYNWWWKSFLVGSSPVIYFILYSIYFFIFKMSITRLSAIVVYFGIMALISSMALFICGSISVLVCFGFIIKIYSNIKID